MTAVEAFWAEHQVGGPYPTLKASIEALLDRKEKFPALEELMPTNQPGKVVVDYGCGPGHDTILFLENDAAHVHYADVSELALRTTRERIRAHRYQDRATGLRVRDDEITRLPKADHIHCAGVLHHVSNPFAVLRTLRDALNRDGEIRLMVYSGGRSPHTQSEVPITRWWSVMDIRRMASLVKLDAEHVGSYPCAAPWRPDAYADCYRLTHE